MRAAPLISGLVLLALPFAAAGQQAAGADAGIAAANEAWRMGWNSRDAAAIAAVYAEDAVVMPPGAEPIEGRAAIQAALTEMLAVSAGSQMAFTTEDVMVQGDMAVEVGSFVETNADGSHRDHGRYLSVMKKIDGSWKIVRDIWNSSMTP